MVYLDLNTLFDDCMALVRDRQPMLVSRLERELRNGDCPSGYCWRKLGCLEAQLRSWGLVVKHVWSGGNVVATYVWHQEYATVVDGRGRTREVRA